MTGAGSCGPGYCDTSTCGWKPAMCWHLGGDICVCPWYGGIRIPRSPTSYRLLDSQSHSATSLHAPMFLVGRMLFLERVGCTVFLWGAGRMGVLEGAPKWAHGITLNHCPTPGGLLFGVYAVSSPVTHLEVDMSRTGETLRLGMTSTVSPRACYASSCSPSLLDVCVTQHSLASVVGGHPSSLAC